MSLSFTIGDADLRRRLLVRVGAPLAAMTASGGPADGNLGKKDTADTAGTSAESSVDTVVDGLISAIYAVQDDAMTSKTGTSGDSGAS